jgi:hypothetical protein
MDIFLVSTIVGVIVGLALLFMVSSWRYWIGYSNGFSEGLNSERSMSSEYIRKLNNDGTIQKIIDSNLEKNPGFINLMDDVKHLLEASHKVWETHGKPDDDLDKALQNFNRFTKS